MKKILNKSFVALTMALVLVLTMVSSAFAAGRQFTDIQGHWAQGVIEKWASIEYAPGLYFANGYENTTFRPNNNVTRAEFVAFVDRYFGLRDKGNVFYPYNDVDPNAWYGYNKEAVIPIAYKAGILADFGGANFYPNQPITRAEAASIIAHAMKITITPTQTKSLLSLYADVNVGSLLSVDIAAVIGAGIMEGDPAVDGIHNFRPYDNLTRAEAIKILDNIQTKYPESQDSHLINVGLNLGLLGILNANLNLGLL